MNRIMFRKKENNFDEEHFLAPDKMYAPFYSWIWNGVVTKEETDKQLEEFVRLGIKAFYIIPEPKTFRPTCMPTLLEPDYLTEEYFVAYTYALQKACALGMIAFLYDEGGWPSGGACSKVLLKHPELAKKTLGKRKRQLQAGVTYVPSSDTLAAFIDGGQQIETGYIPYRDVSVEEYYIKRSFFEEEGGVDCPDTTRDESTNAFIEMTHEGYKRYLKDRFGDNIFAMFTDEPAVPLPFSFREELIDEYQKRYGESLLLYLPALFKQEAQTEEEARVLIRWYDLNSEYFCKNFLQKQKEWCSQNGLAFTGHLDSDHIPDGCVGSAGYHLLRGLRCMDIPGVDVIWRQIYPMEPKRYRDTNLIMGENGFFPRYASSAAAQAGNELAITESFGVYGYIPFEIMRYVLGFQAIKGINIFNLMQISYGKAGFMLREKSYSESHACYADLRTFNEYAERLGYIVSLGERNVSVALYYPINDIWAGVDRDKICAAYKKAGNELEEMGVFFDLFDDDVVRDCDEKTLCEGVIAVGKARYTQLIIPPCNFMSNQTKKRLEMFANGGGKLYVVSGGPSLSGAVVIENFCGIFEPALQFIGTIKNICTYERTLTNGKIILLYNQAFEKQEIAFTSDKTQHVLDITLGRIRSVKPKNGIINLSLYSGETIALLYIEKIDVEAVQEFKNEILLDDVYMFRRTKRFILGDMSCSYDAINEEEIPVALGDWRAYVGEHFSGSAIYKTHFSWQQKIDGKVGLDLGIIGHTCEVFLNGKSLGVRIMKPYWYEFDANLLQIENDLEIRVSNTVANEYKNTKTFDKWKKWQLSPYFEKEKQFNEDYLWGGLFGPIKLFY